MPPPAVSGIESSRAARRIVVDEGGTAVSRGGDVEQHDLVGALPIVARGEGDRIARVAQRCEAHALDDARAVRVEARNDPARQAHGARPPSAARKLASTAAPTAPDFSGWNWTPKTLSRSTTAANVEP